MRLACSTTWCVSGSSSGDNRGVRTAQRTTTSGHIDVRVASAPLVGLRFHLDSRAADLDELAGAREPRLIDVGASRTNLMIKLRGAEAWVRKALEAPPGVARPRSWRT